MNKKSQHDCILITGASSGIGRALALRYAQDGVLLALSGRDKERLDDVAQLCRNLGAEVDARVICVSDRDAMDQWVREVDVHRSLGLVIANAGVSGGSGSVDLIESDDMREMIWSVNVSGVLNTIDPAIDVMAKRQNGQIAIMSSLAGFRGFAGAPTYCASKAAVRVMGESLRVSLRDIGIRVNVICPGFVVSRITDQNKFKMPFLMEAERAANIIFYGLLRDVGRISFPYPMVLGMWFFSLLPDAISGWLSRMAPRKGG